MPITAFCNLKFYNLALREKKKSIQYLSIQYEAEIDGCWVLLQVRIVNDVPIFHSPGHKPDFFASLY